MKNVPRPEKNNISRAALVQFSGLWDRLLSDRLGRIERTSKVGKKAEPLDVNCNGASPERQPQYRQAEETAPVMLSVHASADAHLRLRVRVPCVCACARAFP